MEKTGKKLPSIEDRSQTDRVLTTPRPSRRYGPTKADDVLMETYYYSYIGYFDL